MNFIHNNIKWKLTLKEIMIMMGMKMNLKRMYFMEELINYLLNFVMDIVVNVMKLVILLIDKNVYLVRRNIRMIIGIIIIILIR